MVSGSGCPKPAPPRTVTEMNASATPQLADSGGVVQRSGQRLGIAGARASAIERWFAAVGPPPRLDLARSGAPARSVGDLLSCASVRDTEEYLTMSLDYGPGIGSERLRHAIAARLGAADDDVVVTHGALEGLLLACAATVGARRAVAVAAPGYDGLFRSAEAAGAVVRRVRAWRPGDDRLDLGVLASLDLTRFAAVIVNTPHNPTGACVDGAELGMLAERCEQARTALIVDQVSLATLDPAARSAGRMLGGLAGSLIQVGDVSKSLGLGGLRVGWCVTSDRAWRQRIAALRDVTSLANAAPSQLLAAVALEHHERLSSSRLARANCGRLEALIARLPGAAWVRPADGLVAFPRLPLPWPSPVFAGRLRAAHAVSVTPGAFFGHDRHLRIGLGLPEEDFADALGRLSQALGAPAAA